MTTLTKIISEIAGFCFYLYELWRFSGTELVFAGDGSTELYFARFILLYLALPLMYLFRLAYYLDWEETLSHFLSLSLKFENANTHMQVKLFYWERLTKAA